MSSPITVGVIGATGNVGQSVVQGLLSSPTNFAVTSFTRQASAHSRANQRLREQGVSIVGYDLSHPRETLVEKLKGVTVLISCMTWEHLDLQIPWIEAAKEAGVGRFIPSEWVGPAPAGVIDIKDKKLDILGAIHRARLPYTLIDTGCWHAVFVPKIPSGRSDSAHSIYIDHRIVGDGNQKFALTDLPDVGRFVAKIIADPRTVNKHVFAYTEVLSMNEIWDTMASVSGEEPARDYISKSELDVVIRDCKKRLAANPESAHHPSKIMDTANFNMAQYRISWCVRGDNTPEYAEYLGCLDFWKLFPDFPRGRSLEAFYQEVISGSAAS
ncbi:isoflavone reductase family protein [Aspergillus bertholletiae]|uniref:Isoflavone reductase family protein n=1 Tax=Aspergillus bertholletiae TaxID=1226010 RepID=A0A5N7B0V0_9EURO|nr:isoflavone reductase family protein [Aspergillus bertholletiae]